jgi:hypothetical protein
MVEARAMRGDFAGWSPQQRDAKLQSLAGIIRKYRPESFHFSVDRRHFYQAVSPHAPRAIAAPHYTGAFAVISMITRYLAEMNVEAKVDFIFDQQSGVSADMPLFFDYMIKNIPRKAREMINGQPSFRNDKDMLPLQAADMLAWHLRRQHEKGDVTEALNSLAYTGNSEGHLVTHADTAVISRIGRGLEKIPNVASLKSKGDWKKFRKNLADVRSKGFIPPRGTRWKNLIFELEMKLRWFVGRW